MKNKYFLLLAIAFLGSSLFAQTTVWKAEGEATTWETAENWTEGVPDETTKTVFNVPAAADCLVAIDNAKVKQLVMGDNNVAGGVLTIQDGGVLTTHDEGAWSTVGYNSSAEMIIEAGGTVEAGHRFHVGLVPPAEPATAILEVAGTLNVNVNKFTVNDPGDANWTAEVYVTAGGVINTPNFYIGEGGLVDVSGGTINIMPKGFAEDMNGALAEYVNAGALTAEGGDEEPSIEIVVEGSDTTLVITSSTTVGVFDNKVQKTSLGVYPNPATDVVYFSENVVADVKVYSITGEVVMRRTNVSQLNVENLKPGYYIIKAEADRNTFVDKLLVK